MSSRSTPPGRNTETSTGAFGRGRGVRGGGLEHARDRQRLRGVQREPGAEAAGQHLAAGERGVAEQVAAHGLGGAVEVVAGVVAWHQ